MKKNIYILFTAAALLTVWSCAGDVPPSAPAAPTGLRVVDSAARTVFLKWADNAGNEDNYLVRRSFTDDFAAYEEFSLAANSEYLRDTSSITVDTTYYYRVLAVNEIDSTACAGDVSADTVSSASVPAGKLVADHTIVHMLKNGDIPVSAIEDAKDLVIAYGHTSHGSQLVDGMSGLVEFANYGNCDGDAEYSAVPGLFAWNHDGADGALHLYEGDGYGSGDLDHDCGYFDTTYSYEDYADVIDGGGTPDPNWQYETRYYLGTPSGGRGSNHPEVDVIIWSWCGQSSGKSGQNMMDTYLTPMSELETMYSGIIFVYMTGHLNSDGSYHTANDYIRAYCEDHDKWLFDFADIESYDPNGICYTIDGVTSGDSCVYDFNENGHNEAEDETTAVNGDRNWGTDWQNDHDMFAPDGVLSTADWYNCGAAHSTSINANMKAYAAWWLWCRLAGWDI
ncbi:MAG: fibronectin type III domain-containing protein [Spirochaetales bacterium]|nr:fibronectin type III domain-containing protein [Spirochaetales bacterium]